MMIAMDCSLQAGCESEALAAVRGALRQLGGVLGRLSEPQYAAPSFDGATGSIGAHVRHTLDHLAALLAGMETGVIDYDRRERGTAIERSRAAALEEIERLEGELSRVGGRLDERLTIRATVSGDGTRVSVTSSVARELLFVLNHTVHHQAMIAAAARGLGAALPERFGFSPATICNLNETGGRGRRSAAQEA